jgi:hypothetical protein
MIKNFLVTEKYISDVCIFFYIQKIFDPIYSKALGNYIVNTYLLVIRKTSLSMGKFIVHKNYHISYSFRPLSRKK